MKPVTIAMMSLTHGHTRKYYRTLRDHPRLSWAAVSEEDPVLRERFVKAEPDIPCYSSAEEMLERHPEIEAAVLSSENNRHLEQTALCAERGIHILSMKIPTFDDEEYESMIRMVDESGIICQVELELHYNPVVRRVKELYGSGEWGKLLAIGATNITLSPADAFPWQGIPEKSYGKRVPLRPGDSRFRGGALADHPHIFDLARSLTGSEFESIFAEVAPNLRPETEVEDMLTVVGRMTDGTVVSLDPSWSRMEKPGAAPGPGWELSPKRMEVNLVLQCEKAVITADCFGPNIYHNGAPDSRYNVRYTYFDEWIGLTDEFADCVRTGKQPEINLRRHRNTIRAMNACYESIAASSVVTPARGGEPV